MVFLVFCVYNGFELSTMSTTVKTRINHEFLVFSDGLNIFSLVVARFSW